MQTLLSSGIYPPLPTFFDDQEELDLATLQRHIRRLQNSGIAGYVLMGTNGEAVHLTTDERSQVIEAAREAIGNGDEDGDSLPLLAGCGDQSTRTTLAHCRQAARYGADAALVLPPFYYKGRMNSAALIAHYRAVADDSPLPVLLYNMPGASAGVDLDAETVCALAEHPNIIGVKDSAGNIAKLAQIVAHVPDSFRVFVGSASYLLPALVVGAVGAVTALANVFPQEVCLLQALFEAGELEEARTLQARIIPANAAVTTIYSVPGLKAALEISAGYGGKPRRPLQPLSLEERNKLAAILEAMPLEL
jgi:4-hydroxy-2-oxoglutarate aldolase